MVRIRNIATIQNHEHSENDDYQLQIEFRLGVFKRYQPWVKLLVRAGFSQHFSRLGIFFFALKQLCMWGWGAVDCGCSSEGRGTSTLVFYDDLIFSLPAMLFLVLIILINYLWLIVF